MRAASPLAALVTLALACSAASAVAPAQQPETTIDTSPPASATIHLERPDDPPAGAPASPRSGSPRVTATRGPYTSIQVNVGPDGNDVLFDAANEPSIAVDPTDHNRIAIGWRQFDNIASNFREAGRAFSNDGGQTWVNPGDLTPGVFRSDPVLAADRLGAFYYHSLKGDFSVDFFKSTDAGQTWSAPIPAPGGDKVWFAIDTTGGVGDGHIYCAWNTAAGCCGLNTFTRSTDGAASWLTPIQIPNRPIFGSVAIGTDGEVYVAGVSNTNFSRIIVARSDNARFAGQAPTFASSVQVDLGGSVALGAGPNPVGLLGQIWVAVDHSPGPNHGDVYVLASVDPPGDDPLDVMFSRSTDNGLTWTPPIRLNDDPVTRSAWQWFGTLSVAPNGRLDAVWNDTRSHPLNVVSELYYAFSVDGGRTWSANLPLSPAFNHSLGYPNQNKLGDYYHMLSDESGADLAWAATFSGGQDVYYLRIPADCNNNGVLDPDDVTNGTSEDCNGNGIPDECEPDCNENGVADACDTMNGTSQDCTGNQIPDECEPDCNGNAVADSCDILSGFSIDCTANGIPDECETDCNDNGIRDDCDIDDGFSEDCQPNGVPDECDLDSDEDGIPDDCDPDLDGDDVLDTIDNCPGLFNPAQADCDGDEVGDACAILAGAPVYANLAASTGQLQTADPIAHDLHFGHVVQMTAFEVSFRAGGSNATLMTVAFYANDAANAPRPPDGLIAAQSFALVAGARGELRGEFDPPQTLPPDVWLEVQFGDPNFGWKTVGAEPTVGTTAGHAYNRTTEMTTAARFRARVIAVDDCNANGVPDACDVADATSPDCNATGSPDECDIIYGTSADCNSNNIPDECDIAGGTSLDGNGDAVPDECAPGACACADFNADNVISLVDFTTFAVCFGATAPTLDCPALAFSCADLDASGFINLTDFTTFATIFALSPDGIAPPNCLAVD